MSIRLHLFVVVTSAAALSVGCENGPPQPISPSIVQDARPTGVPLLGATRPAAAGQMRHTVVMFDACDPETFNAVLGPGTCTRSGGVRFEKFIEQLERHQSIGAWHFAPPHVMMQVGQLLVATNRGGEVHTFTEVEEFGGGIVAELNVLTGLTAVAPECNQLAPEDFLPPGASSSEEEEEAGVEKYQCCIHPWMRAEVRITQK